MSQAVTSPGSSRLTRRILGLALVLALVGAVAYLATTRWWPWPAAPAVAQEGKADPGETPREPDDERTKLLPAPELEGGTAWLNTASPLRLKDMRGKFVLLDF